MTPNDKVPSTRDKLKYEWDIFLSYAHEDEEFVKELHGALTNAGVRVWIDYEQGQLGHDLTDIIEKGIVSSDFAIIVLSPDYWEKYWTTQERRGINATEQERKRPYILPIWHQIDPAAMRSKRPFLAHRLALTSAHSIDAIVGAVQSTLHRKTPSIEVLPELWWQRRWVRISGAVAAASLALFAWTRFNVPSVEFKELRAKFADGGRAVVVSYDIEGAPPGSTILIHLDDDAEGAEPYVSTLARRSDSSQKKAIFDLLDSAPVTHAQVVVDHENKKIRGPIIPIKE